MKSRSIPWVVTVSKDGEGAGRKQEKHLLKTLEMQDDAKRLIFVLMLFIWISPNDLLAQHQEHDHDHNTNLHEHPKNEIGIGNYLSYLVGENEFAYGLHIHYLRSFEESRFGAGVGYEQIFDEHRHRSLTLIGAFRPVSPLVLSLAPGIVLGTPENQSIRFALHVEAVYEFEISHFHLGPAIEFATTFDEYHIGVGLHLAYAF